MPRRARLTAAGIPWHIIQRGNNRAACFHAELDFIRYLDTLRDQAEAHQCAIHAYVLMTNHVHLLLTPAREDSAGLMMKHLGQRYVQYFNRTYRRSGTLWEGRYRSSLAPDPAYVLTCFRYIEMNPVRAQMVAHPRDYRWSSYHANAEGKYDPLVAPQADYLQLGSTADTRRAAYRNLFLDCLDPGIEADIRRATNGNFVLGAEQYQQEIGRMLQRRVVPGKSGRPTRGDG